MPGVGAVAAGQCEGRGPTTQGLRLAGEYIARQMKEAGLKPGFKGDWFQPFAIAGARTRGALQSPRAMRILNRGAAVCMGGAAATIAARS